LSARNPSSIVENHLSVVNVERERMKELKYQSSKMSFTFLFLPKINMLIKSVVKKHILTLFFSSIFIKMNIQKTYEIRNNNSNNN